MYHLAIDIGASSGRHILGHVKDGKLLLEEVYRFENRQVVADGHVCWNLEALWQEILAGMKRCAALGKVPATMGVDTWGVDFVLLDSRDRLLTQPVAYRDGRTAGMDEWVSARISLQELYRRTGIQKQSFNTIYQLAALGQTHPDQLQNAARFLMLPDYFHFLLTGVKKNEYTNATTTSLVDAESCDWDRELLARLGFPAACFSTPELPGTPVGNLRREIREEVGFDTLVVLPATHDTGSAYLAVPAQTDREAYLSSGTWSLLGVERRTPITTEASRLGNFTNEGGAWRRYRYLRNIMGLWMIQSVRKELNSEGGASWSFPALSQAAMENEDFPSVVDVNLERFLAPKSMVDAIRQTCAETGQKAPQTPGQVAQCIYRSLALCYEASIRELEAITGVSYTCIRITGGGCQDAYLNRCTALQTGLPVYAGPQEGTAVGNLLVQMIYSREFPDLQSARDAVRRSFTIKEFLPNELRGS